MHSLHF